MINRRQLLASSGAVTASGLLGGLSFPGIAAGDDEIVAAQIELLDGKRHEGDVMAVVFAPAGQLLHERGLHRLPLQEGTALVIEPVDETEKIGIGIDQDDLFEHALSSAIDRKPVVDDGDTTLGLGYFHQREVAELGVNGDQFEEAMFQALRWQATICAVV